MKINKRALALGVGLLGYFGAVTGYNFYTHHNISYENGNKKVVEKADGILAYTTLEIDRSDESIDVTRRDFLNWRSYEDKNGDGNVDWVYRTLGNPLIRGSHSRSFYRDKDLTQFPVVFEEADKDFRKQMERFKQYINR
ncbi:hypothetical protein J4466_01485 [Candidatus Pacearchaeota archaeon]|nr:hypothetical protein [Candidatus Pacearchaeota archaeon]